MNILGISCFYHDSSACLVQKGIPVAFAQEERFNRQKNTSVFPLKAINYCLQEGKISVSDIDYIAFYEKPFLKFSRVIFSHIRSFPFSFPNFLRTMPHWLEDRLIMPLVVKRELGYDGKVIFIKHHFSHAASSFLVSPFEEAVILTADGIGEWASMTAGMGKGNQITISRELQFPDSLGLLYTAITTYLGFESLEGEGKVMGLAGYAPADYVDILKKTLFLKPDGSFSLDQRFYGFFNEGRRMYSSRLVKLLGKERKKGAPLEERHKAIASSLQQLVEEIIIRMARSLYEEARIPNICLAGGVFLNCVANAKLLEETPFKNIFVQPAAGDAGGALGAAMAAHCSMLNQKRVYVMENGYLGPEFTHAQIQRAVVTAGVRYTEYSDKDLYPYVAQKILQNKVVGWFQGRMEIGPRALGNRSILGNPCTSRIKDLINDKVKHREPFRPFAPVVLQEKAAEYFDLSVPSPFMLLAPAVKKEMQARIPAVTHCDGTARVQTVTERSNPRLYLLIKVFESISGVPVLVNTSFNLRGEPVVCAPEDAVRSFQKSQMDYLVMGNTVVER